MQTQARFDVENSAGGGAFRERVVLEDAAAFLEWARAVFTTARSSLGCLVRCLRNSYTIVAHKLALGKRRDEGAQPWSSVTEEQRRPRPISVQPQLERSKPDHVVGNF